MDYKEKLESKETTLVKKDVESITQKANDVKITSQEEYNKGVELAGEIVKSRKQVVGRKNEILKPLNEASKSVRDFFRPFEAQIAEAEKVIKVKISDYHTEQEKKSEEKRKKLAERVGRGTMKPDTAEKKMGEVEAPQKTTQSGDTKVTVKTVKKVVVDDESKLPREYLMPNERKIKADVKNGKEIPGVTIKEEKVSSIY